MCQISRQSDNAFAFYSSFCKCAKRGRNIRRRRKKTKKLSQFLKSHISGMPEVISLKFGMWSTEVGGNLHSKICLVSSRQHRATEVRKLRFVSSCQYTHGIARRLLGPHDTLPCVLISRPGANTTKYNHQWDNLLMRHVQTVHGQHSVCRLACRKKWRVKVRISTLGYSLP